MKTVYFALLAVLALNVQADPIFAAGFDPAPSALPRFNPADTQFVIGEFLLVETVTCTAYSVHYDLNQYGSIEGSGCTATGYIPDVTGTWGGHVGATFALTAGGTVALSDCRVVSHTEAASLSGPPSIGYSVDCQ